MSRRCSECRAHFEPEASAREKQRVCGPGCRKLRRARLARQRRRADLDEFRAEERERQRQCRERRRTAVAAELGSQSCRGSPQSACSGRGGQACHGLASARKPLNLHQEVLEMVDSSLTLSRASLERATTRIRQQLSRLAARDPLDSGQRVARGSAVSRADLGP